jgi:hypothetical protein
MDYKEVLGEEIDKYSLIRFAKLAERHEYILDKQIGENTWVKNDKIYLDGNFNADQLEALSLFLRDKLNEL